MLPFSRGLLRWRGSLLLRLCSWLPRVCAAPAAEGTVEETLRARWTDAYNSGDVKTLSAMYASDARIQHGYCPAVTGRDAIETFWSEDLSEGAPRTHLEIVDSFSLDEVIYLSGNYVVEVEGSTEPHTGGTYTQIWRRDGASEWTIYRESWTNLACAKLTQRSKPHDNEGNGSTGVSL